MKVYSQLIKARLEQVSSDLSETISGLFWQNTTSKKLKFYDGSEVKEVCDTNSSQTLTNKTLTAPVVDAATYVQTSTAPSSPASGRVKLYFKNDGKAYVKDSSGVEKKIGTGGGGSSLVWDKNTTLPPSDVSQDGIKLEGFDSTEAQELSLLINVPADYDGLVQIKLIGGAFCTSAVTGSVLFKTETTLIRPNTSVLGTYSNKYTSTNSAVTVSSTANLIKSIGDIDLTNSSCAINSITVQAGDKLRVRLYRDVTNEGTSAAAVAKVLINNFEVKFF